MLQTEIQALLQDGIITRSNSLFSAPCFVKPKPDRSGRILIDYRQLNSGSIEIQYHFPSVSEQFHRFLGMKYFSKLDLKKGFYQVNISPADRHKTAFATTSGKYEFTRLPFGILNAPKYFHNLITEIMAPIENTIVFVDDIIVFAKTEREHLALLDQTFNRLAKRNVIINLDKSKFFTQSINYLGFEIEEHGFKPDLSRLENFHRWEPPTTRKQLQRLLGKINWYRPFIRGASNKLAPPL